jgi:heat shock protein HtpX
MSNRFRSDPRLTARMTITLFLLGLLYVLFATALIALLKSWVLVVVVAALLLGAQYWY